MKVPGWGGSTWDKVLSVVLVVAILGALGTLGYVIAAPKVGERFTEFYILGMEGKAADYPRELAVGERAEVIVGIVNHEDEVVSYRVEVRIGGVGNDELGPVVLEYEQEWEGAVSFAPDKAGDNQKVEFVLYKGEEVEPYLMLHLWIDVS
ncbi:MAG TPA: hypothetical protein DIT43_04380 [Dehalococcoidia bacterium]|nr:hypothetical protein [Dehalococcoidia bacterium]